MYLCISPLSIYTLVFHPLPSVCTFASQLTHPYMYTFVFRPIHTYLCFSSPPVHMHFCILSPNPGLKCRFVVVSTPYSISHVCLQFTMLLASSYFSNSRPRLAQATEVQENSYLCHSHNRQLLTCKNLN